MKKTLLVGACLVLVAMLPEAHAGKWGMAGCGVGSLIFEDQPGKIQILAATTNQYFVQSSSITTGTSNCVDSPKDTASLFIAINEEPLKKDISRGGGETVDGLAKIFRCDNVGEFGQTLQKNYGAIFSDDKSDSNAIREKIETAVRGNPQMAGACRVIS